MISRSNLTILAVMGALVACTQAIRPSPPPAMPAPDEPGRVASTVAEDPAQQRATADKDHEGPPDSLTIGLREAIASAGAVFGLPDSALSIGTETAKNGTSLAEAMEPEEASWDLDVLSYVTQERVAHYISLFSGAARERVEARLRVGQRYEPMIRAKFKAAGIPEDMYYLALVESGYEPHAYSRAAAVGMWQFMTTTARGVGLRVDWWVDERRDPAKATDAAARFIDILQKQFGSYYLAAAAYNGGPGRVSRGLTRFTEQLEDVEGDDKFFALAQQNYLRAETKNYVPQLIASALIGKEPKRYGILLDSVVDPWAYDSVSVPSFTPLAAVAEAIGSNPAVVRDLNGHFLRGVTPPAVVSWVRVPPGSQLEFTDRFAALTEMSMNAFDTVRTSTGQTLATFAKAQGVTTRSLQWYNRQIRYTAGSKTRLVAGQAMLVPKAHVLAVARDVPDPAVERYGTSSASGRTVHVVRRGESLGSIAKRYRTSVATLVRLNGLKKQVIYPGQSIVVRGSTVRRAPTPARRPPTPAKKPAASASKAAGTGAAR